MNSDNGHVISMKDIPLKADRSVLESKWPPFPRAISVLTPKHLIDAQADLVRQLCAAIPFSDEEVECYLMPVIWNLACFVHLLPASAHHHHRGLGGLFGHSLEVALFSAQTAKNKIFDFKARPEDAYANKSRWILACALAGLIHDVGKAVLDIRVYSDKGAWNPATGSITEWAQREGIKEYFLSMKEDREHNKHEQASLAYARVMIPKRTYLFLSKTGNPKIEEELHAAISGQREETLVGEVLGLADQLSVKLDNQRQGQIDPREKLVTTPLADAIVAAMRTLIKEGTWAVNTKKGSVWVTTQGCFIDWHDVSDITRVLAAENITSVPHDNGAMADVLLTEGLIEGALKTFSSDERFWPVVPFVSKERTYTCVKFRVPVRLMGTSAYEPIPVYIPKVPMLEKDALAWKEAYGFDPSEREHQPDEDEEYLDTLVDEAKQLKQFPTGYSESLVGFFTSDGENLTPDMTEACSAADLAFIDALNDLPFEDCSTSDEAADTSVAKSDVQPEQTNAGKKASKESSTDANEKDGKNGKPEGADEAKPYSPAEVTAVDLRLKIVKNGVKGERDSQTLEHPSSVLERSSVSSTDSVHEGDGGNSDQGTQGMQGIQGLQGNKRNVDQPTAVKVEPAPSSTLKANSESLNDTTHVLGKQLSVGIVQEEPIDHMDPAYAALFGALKPSVPKNHKRKKKKGKGNLNGQLNANEAETSNPNDASVALTNDAQNESMPMAKGEEKAKAKVNVKANDMPTALDMPKGEKTQIMPAGINGAVPLSSSSCSGESESMPSPIRASNETANAQDESASLFELNSQASSSEQSEQPIQANEAASVENKGDELDERNEDVALDVDGDADDNLYEHLYDTSHEVRNGFADLPFEDMMDEVLDDTVPNLVQRESQCKYTYTSEAEAEEEIENESFFLAEGHKPLAGEKVAKGSASDGVQPIEPHILISTVEDIRNAHQHPRDRAAALITAVKSQLLAKNGDLLPDPVWKNALGVATSDKGFTRAMMSLVIPVPVMVGLLRRFQPSPKLIWDREEGKLHLKIDK